MSRHFLNRKVVVFGLLVSLTGCQPQQPFYFHEKGEVADNNYIMKSTDIEYPDANVPSLPDAESDAAPLTLSHPEPKEYWDLSLQEAMQNALKNSKVMKQIGAGVTVQSGTAGPSAPSFLTSNGTGASTSLDVALAETDPRFGVEAALSAFDAQFTASMNWNKIDEPVNSNQAGVLYPPSGGTLPVSIGDGANFQASLQKVNAEGGTIAVNHNITYSNTNALEQAFQSDYNVNIELQITQPLLRGAGETFNRIAGPGAIPGVSSGVVIARLNTDIALAAFESSVRNMVSDVENAYWELYFAYRNLDSVVLGRDAALGTWRKVYALYLIGARGGEADKEAQAREQYFLFRFNVERSQIAMYKAESNLRYMMGIAATDGRLIRPAEEPTTARVDFDWSLIHNEGLVRSPELRQQRWTVKKREMELIAAKNFLLPRLDFQGRYRFLGLGNELGAASQTTNNEYAFGYNNMMTGQYQEWTVGFVFQMNLGFRKEMDNVRNAETRLVRERCVLQEQELELSHQLAFAVRNVDANHVLSKTNWNRRLASQRQLEALQAAYDTGNVAIDVLLLAQRQLATDESDYFRSVVDYNESIKDMHYRKGSLLEYNGINLAEGPWPAKAYFDATRQARARDAAKYMDYGFTRPQVISRGPYAQFMGTSTGIVPESGTPSAEQMNRPDALKPMPQATPNQVPTLAPKPAEKPQASGPQLLPPEGRTVTQATPATEKKGYAVEATALGTLTAAGAKPPAAAAGQWSGVRATGYSQSDSSHEPNANVPAVESDRSSSGWSGVQR